MATGQAAAGNDVVYTCALADGAVSCISSSGMQTVVPVPAGQDPLGDWLLEPLLEVARLQPGQTILRAHVQICKGDQRNINNSERQPANQPASQPPSQRAGQLAR